VNQSVRGIQKLAEQSSSPTVPTGLGYVYFKSDGNLYAKNDAGEEVQLTSGEAINGIGAVNEYIWGPSQISPGGVKVESDIDGYSIKAEDLANGATSTHTLETIRIPEGIVTEISNGKDLLLECCFMADGEGGAETGDVVVQPKFLIHDQSAATTSETSFSQSTHAVSSEELTIASEQASVSVDSGDSITPTFTRLGADGSDTLLVDLHLVWVRMSTTEPAGS